MLPEGQLTTRRRRKNTKKLTDGMIQASVKNKMNSGHETVGYAQFEVKLFFLFNFTQGLHIPSRFFQVQEFDQKERKPFQVFRLGESPCVLKTSTCTGL